MKLQLIMATELETAACLLLDGELEPERAKRGDGERDPRCWCAGEVGRPRGEDGERHLPLLEADGDTQASASSSADFIHELLSSAS